MLDPVLAVDAGTVWSAIGASTLVSAGVAAATTLLGQRLEFTRRLRLTRAEEARRYRDRKADRVREGVRLMVKALHLVSDAVYFLEVRAKPGEVDRRVNEVVDLFDLARIELSLDDEAKPLLDLFHTDAFQGFVQVQSILGHHKQAVEAAKAMPGYPGTDVIALAKQVEAQLKKAREGIHQVEQACRDVLRTLEEPVEP